MERKIISLSLVFIIMLAIVGCFVTGQGGEFNLEGSWTNKDNLTTNGILGMNLYLEDSFFTMLLTTEGEKYTGLYGTYEVNEDMLVVTDSNNPDEEKIYLKFEPKNKNEMVLSTSNGNKFNMIRMNEPTR